MLVGKSNMSNLAKPIGEEKRVENVVVKKLVEESQGKEDCVDLEEGDIIHGVGDQGVVLVLLGLEEDGENGRNERMVMISLPEKEVDHSKRS
ncbi:hypothetical protein JHK85_041222 [Glycine max]|nr:hypothetical protein JHK86_040630 [Glycine max]KAG4966247.1 hypothetical protein JHK85_041222 [Glycine max]